MKYSIYDAVENLNKSYTTKSKNEFKVSGAYGGYKIIFTGKTRKVGKVSKTLGMPGAAELTYGYVSAKDVLAQLGMMCSNKDYIKNFVKSYESYK